MKGMVLDIIWQALFGAVFGGLLTGGFYALMRKSDPIDEENVYSFTKGFRWSMGILFFACLGFVGLAYVGLMHEEDSSEIMAIYFLFAMFGGGALLLLPMLFKLYDQIVVLPDGIKHINWRKEETFLRWQDMSMRERPHLQRLELHGTAGELIKVEYQIGRFEEIQRVLSEKISERNYDHMEINLPTTFHRSSTGTGLLILRFGIVLAVVVALLYFGRIVESIVFLGIFAAISYHLLLDWKTVEIREEGIQINFARDYFPVAWGDIEEIKMMAENDQGDVTQYIQVLLRDGSFFDLTGSDEGDILFYQTLKKAYQEYGAE